MIRTRPITGRQRIDQTMDFVIFARSAKDVLPLLDKKMHELPAARLQIENQMRNFMAAEKILPNRFAQLANWMENSQEHAHFVHEMLQEEGATGLLQELETACSTAREKQNAALSGWTRRIDHAVREGDGASLRTIMCELFEKEKSIEVLKEACDFAARLWGLTHMGESLGVIGMAQAKESIEYAITELKERNEEYAREVKRTWNTFHQPGISEWHIFG